MALRSFQSAFTGGEISPQAQGRLDLDKYPIGADRLKNMAVRVQGGATRRPGTYHIAAASDADQRSWLFPFIFSNEQAYVLEFSPLVIRVFQDRRLLTGDGDGSELVTNGTFAADLSSWSEVNTGTGDAAWNAASGGVARLNGGTGASRLGQGITTVADEDYVLAWTATRPVLVRIGTSDGDDSIHEEAYDAGARQIKVTATTTTTWVHFIVQSANDTDLDNVSMQLAEALVIASPYTADVIPSLRFAQSADVLYIFSVDFAPYKLLRITAIEWQLRPVVFSPAPTRELPQAFAGTLTPSATTGSAITVTTSTDTFNESDINRIIIGGAGRASITGYTSATQVTANVIDAFASTDAIPGGQWFLLGSPFFTLTPDVKSPVGAIVTLTASGNSFRSTDLGRYVRGNGGFARIVSVTSATEVKGEIKVAFTSTAAIEAGAWTLEDPIYSEARGWPGVGTFHEQRLVVAGSTLEPLTFNGSRSNDFENFTLGTLETDAYDYVIPGPFDTLRGLVSLRRLLLGTGGAWLQARGSADGPISPAAAPLVIPENDKGVDYDTAPVIVNNAVLFLQRGGTRIREMAYNFGDDAYNAYDLTVLVDHLTSAGLVQLARATAPDSYVYAVRSDGALLCCAYERPEKVVAWSRWITGRRQDLSDGFFESVCAIPNNCNTGDEVWVAVRRRITITTPVANLSPGSGATTEGQAGVTFTASAAVFSADDVGRTITDLVNGGTAKITAFGSTTSVTATITEAFDSLVAIAADDWDLCTQRRSIELFDFALQVDAAVRYAGDAATILSGLDHLVGDTVQIVADDVDDTAEVDADGQITLADPAEEIQAGLAFTSRIVTLRPELQLPGGVTAGRVRRVADVVVRFFCTGPGWTIAGLDAGLTGAETELIQDKRVPTTGWSRGDGRITVEQTRPFKGTILSIGGRVEVEDDG